MDDGLVLIFIASNQNQSTGLNPYCSGRWSRTMQSLKSSTYLHGVLILIVVEDGLVPKKAGSFFFVCGVLILIVVEDGLVLT